MPRTKASAPETGGPELEDFLPDGEPAVSIADTGKTFTPVTNYPHEPDQAYEYDSKLFSDWWEFVRNVPPDAPYDLLNQLPFHRGFVYKITEMHTSVHDQSMTVMFQILIGRTMDDLRHLDNFTVQVPRNTVAPSLAARSIAMPTVIYTIFGRLPPEQPPIPAPQPAPAAPQPAPQPVREAPQPAPAAPWQQEEEKNLDIVGNFTPDGLPILVDLYAYKADPGDIVEAAISTLQDALVNVTTQAGLSALWGKNEMAVEFIKDFGEKRHKERLAKMFKDRANELRRNA